MLEAFNTPLSLNIHLLNSSHKYSLSVFFVKYLFENRLKEPDIKTLALFLACKAEINTVCSPIE